MPLPRRYRGGRRGAGGGGLNVYSIIRSNSSDMVSKETSFAHLVTVLTNHIVWVNGTHPPLPTKTTNSSYSATLLACAIRFRLVRNVHVKYTYYWAIDRFLGSNKMSRFARARKDKDLNLVYKSN